MRCSLRIIAFALVGCSSSPGEPARPSPNATTLEPAEACPFGSSLDGEAFALDDQWECLQPEPLAAFCSGRPEWVDAFGAACPTRDAFVAAAEAGAPLGIYGTSLLGVAVQSCPDGVTALDLRPPCYDCIAETVVFAATGTLLAVAFDYEETYDSATCCEDVVVSRAWIGTPPGSMACSHQDDLVIISDSG